MFAPGLTRSAVVALAAVLGTAGFWPAISVAGEVVLIDAETRNGSFLTGETAPWAGYIEVTDESDASVGEHFGQINYLGSRFAPVFQTLTVDPTDGLVFRYRFDVKSLNGELTDVEVSVWGRDASRAIVSASIEELLHPEASNQWQRYEGIARFSSDRPFVAEEEFTLAINFYSDANEALAIAGLDAVELVQVPEPGSLALLGLGGAAMFWRRQRITSAA